MKKDTALELACFITEDKIEFKFIPCKNELVAFINLPDLKDFVDILGYGCFDEEGINCVLKFEYIAFNFIEVLDMLDLYDNPSFMKILLNHMDDEYQRNFQVYLNRLESHEE